MENIAILSRRSTTLTALPSTATSAPRVYFKNFDGLRFFAALLVILQHMSNYKTDLGADIPNREKTLFSTLGSSGVMLFFVLSGFLIFYLLFTEKKFTGTIRIKDFYVRRMLRIWPLYFGFGLLSILGIDSVIKLLSGTSTPTPVAENLFYLFTFSVNLQLIFGTINRGIIELYWSVCIEEQFYLFAPWLVKKSNRFIAISLGLIGVGIASKFIFGYLLANEIIHVNRRFNPLYVFTTCWFEAFGFGILAAYLLFNKELYSKIKGVVENRIIQAVVVGIMLLYIINFIPKPKIVTDYLFATVPSILFAFIILAAASGNFVFNLENNFFKRLGRYSYGMYVLHATILQVVLILSLKYVSRSNTLFYELVSPLMSIGLVIFASGLSYELYEKRFLKLKQVFTVVKNQKV